MAGEEPQYIARLHDYECACQPCASRDIQASHPRTGGMAFGGKKLGGKPGKGQRSEDKAAYPVCSRHHGQAQRYEFAKPNSYFYGWDRKRFAAWEADEGAKSYARYLSELDALKLSGADARNAARRLRSIDGFDTTSEIEELVQIFQPNGGELRLQLKRFARRLRDAVEHGKAF